MPVRNASTDDMVCVVRGLPDAKLAVTLLDGKKYYTLRGPEKNCLFKDGITCSRAHFERTAATPKMKKDASTTYYKNVNLQHNLQCDSATQDNRFASSYQVAHCKITPTTLPILEVSEFPPQKLKPCRKDGNFEVRSMKSGLCRDRSCSPTKFENADSGIITSRHSKETNLFANSLRKYPHSSKSLEKSTELLEKLINVTLQKPSHGRTTSLDHVIAKKRSSSPSPRSSPKLKESFDGEHEKLTKMIRSYASHKANIEEYLNNKYSSNNASEIIKDVIMDDVDGQVIDANYTSHHCPVHFRQRKCERGAHKAAQSSHFNQICVHDLIVTNSNIPPDQEEEFNKIIKQWVDTLPDHNSVVYKKELTKIFVDHLRPFAMKPAKSKEIHQQILLEKTLNILKALPDISGYIDKETLVQYANYLVDQLSNLNLYTQATEPVEDANEVMLKNEVVDVLTNARIVTNKKQINKTANKIVDILNKTPENMRLENDEATVRNISNVLQRDIPKIKCSEAIELSNTITNRVHEMSVGPRRSPSPEMDSDKIKVLIKSWLKNESIRIKNDKAIDELAMRLVHIEKHNEESIEKRDLEALAQTKTWLDDNLAQRKDSTTRVAVRLINQLGAHRNVPKVNNENHEQVYIRELENKINDWLDNLEINSKSLQLQNEAVKELAADVNKRQKYIKNNQNIQVSEEEENKYLKNQILKMLNKISKRPYDINNLPPETRELVNLLKTPKNKYSKNKSNILHQSKSQFGDNIDQVQSEENFDTFTEEIADWCNNLPLPTTSSDQEREALILEIILLIFKNINDLAREEKIFNNDTLLRQKLLKGVNKILDNLPKNPELERVKRNMADQLVEKIIENKHCFKKSSNVEYLNILNNFVDYIFSFVENHLPTCRISELKSQMIQQIHFKAFELAKNPEILDDARLFQDLMCEEIEILIDSLPKVEELQNVKHVQALFISNEIYKNRYLYSENTSEACICPNDALHKINKKEISSTGGYESFRKDIPFNSSLIQTQGQVDRQPIKNLSNIPEESLAEFSGQSTSIPRREVQLQDYESFRNEVPINSSFIHPQKSNTNKHICQHIPDQIRTSKPSGSGGVSIIGERQTASPNMQSPKKYPEVEKNNVSYQNYTKFNNSIKDTGIHIRNDDDQRSPNSNIRNQNSNNFSNYQPDEREYYTLESENSILNGQRTPSNISKNQIISQHSQRNNVTGHNSTPFRQNIRKPGEENYNDQQRCVSENHLQGMCPPCHRCRDHNLNSMGGMRHAIGERHINDPSGRKNPVGSSGLNRMTSEPEFEGASDLSAEEVQSIKQFIEKISPRLGLEVVPKNTNISRNRSNSVYSSSQRMNSRTYQQHHVLCKTMREIKPQVESSGCRQSRWSISNGLQNSPLDHTGGFLNKALDIQAHMLNINDYKGISDVNYKYNNTRQAMEKLRNRASDSFHQSNETQWLNKQSTFRTTIDNVMKSNEHDQDSDTRSVPEEAKTSMDCCGPKCPFPSFLYFKPCDAVL